MIGRVSVGVQTEGAGVEGCVSGARCSVAVTGMSGRGRHGVDVVNCTACMVTAIHATCYSLV